ncbi:MAG: metallophosphoesterase [Clostridia bacterium]|nr:metallophosphoesterase [Clostridia bacterium]
MALYTIADLHLSTLDATNKSMEVFGGRWQDYTARLKAGWERLVTEADTVIIPGDVSWALSLEEAVSDFKFIDALPGRKIIGKGNHDFWWMTMQKHRALFDLHGIRSIDFLFNNAHEVEDFIIAGTRGWYYDEDNKNAPDNADFKKLVAREELRLRTSLRAAAQLREKSPEKEIVVFTHFPPHWAGRSSDGMIEILKEYGIRRLYFGHIHGSYAVPPVTEHEGIKMHLISADYLSFVPKNVPKEL